MMRKLSLSDAIKIRTEHRRGKSSAELAQTWGVTVSNISAIVTRKTHSVSKITRDLQQRAKHNQGQGGRVGEFGKVTKEEE